MTAAAIRRTFTGQAGQFRDAHGPVLSAWEQPCKKEQRRDPARLMRDYRASVIKGIHHATR